MGTYWKAALNVDHYYRECVLCQVSDCLQNVDVCAFGPTDRKRFYLSKILPKWTGLSINHLLLLLSRPAFAYYSSLVLSSRLLSLIMTVVQMEFSIGTAVHVLYAASVAFAKIFSYNSRHAAPTFCKIGISRAFVDLIEQVGVSFMDPILTWYVFFLAWDIMSDVNWTDASLVPVIQ